MTDLCNGCCLRQPALPRCARARGSRQPQRLRAAVASVIAAKKFGKRWRIVEGVGQSQGEILQCLRDAVASVIAALLQNKLG